jgi:hypothetical protein
VLTARRGKIILMWILVETSASDVGTMFNLSPARELTTTRDRCAASVTGRAGCKGGA